MLVAGICSLDITTGASVDVWVASGELVDKPSVDVEMSSPDVIAATLVLTGISV